MCLNVVVFKILTGLQDLFLDTFLRRQLGIYNNGKPIILNVNLFVFIEVSSDEQNRR